MLHIHHLTQKSLSVDETPQKRIPNDFPIFLLHKNDVRPPRQQTTHRHLVKRMRTKPSITLFGLSGKEVGQPTRIVQVGQTHTIRQHLLQLPLLPNLNTTCHRVQLLNSLPHPRTFCLQPVCQFVQHNVSSSNTHSRDMFKPRSHTNSNSFVPLH